MGRLGQGLRRTHVELRALSIPCRGRGRGAGQPLRHHHHRAGGCHRDGHDPTGRHPDQRGLGRAGGRHAGELPAAPRGARGGAAAARIPGHRGRARGRDGADRRLGRQGGRPRREGRRPRRRVRGRPHRAGQAGEGVRDARAGEELGRAHLRARAAEGTVCAAVPVHRRRQHRYRGIGSLGAVPQGPGGLLPCAGGLHLWPRRGIHPGREPECAAGGDPAAVYHPGGEHPDPAGQPVHCPDQRRGRSGHLGGQAGRRGEAGRRNGGPRGFLALLRGGLRDRLG